MLLFKTEIVSKGLTTYCFNKVFLYLNFVACEVKQNLSSQNKDYLELIIFKKQQTQEKLCKPKEKLPFIREI